MILSRRCARPAETNDFYLTANNNSANRKVLPELWDDIVQIPEYLASTIPGGFFWMGPAGTITPFHHDLTNNFMAQVIGRKRIKIAPSWDMPLDAQLPSLLFPSRRPRHAACAAARGSRSRRSWNSSSIRARSSSCRSAACISSRGSISR